MELTVTAVRPEEECERTSPNSPRWHFPEGVDVLQEVESSDALISELRLPLPEIEKPPALKCPPTSFDSSVEAIKLARKLNCLDLHWKENKIPNSSVPHLIG